MGVGEEGGAKEGCRGIKTTKKQKQTQNDREPVAECMTQLARSRHGIHESWGGRGYEGGVPGNKKQNKKKTPIESLR